MRLHWSVHIMVAFGIVGAALYFSDPANAAPQVSAAVSSTGVSA